MENRDYNRPDFVENETEKRIEGPSGNSSLTMEMKLICCIIPLVGLVMFLINKDEKPLEAKESLKWACVGIAIGIGLSVFARMTIYAIW